MGECLKWVNVEQAAQVGRVSLVHYTPCALHTAELTTGSTSNVSSNVKGSSWEDRWSTTQSQSLKRKEGDETEEGQHFCSHESVGLIDWSYPALTGAGNTPTNDMS